MRVRTIASGLTVNAVAGSYVVVLGLDVDAATRAGLQWFAILKTAVLECRDDSISPDDSSGAYA